MACVPFLPQSLRTLGKAKSGLSSFCLQNLHDAVFPLQVRADVFVNGERIAHDHEVLIDPLDQARPPCVQGS